MTIRRETRRAASWNRHWRFILLTSMALVPLRPMAADNPCSVIAEGTIDTDDGLLRFAQRHHIRLAKKRTAGIVLRRPDWFVRYICGDPTTSRLYADSIKSLVPTRRALPTWNSTRGAERDSAALREAFREARRDGLDWLVLLSVKRALFEECRKVVALADSISSEELSGPTGIVWMGDLLYPYYAQHEPYRRSIRKIFSQGFDLPPTQRLYNLLWYLPDIARDSSFRATAAQSSLLKFLLAPYGPTSGKQAVFNTLRALDTYDSLSEQQRRLLARPLECEWPEDRPVEDAESPISSLESQAWQLGKHFSGLARRIKQSYGRTHFSTEELSAVRDHLSRLPQRYAALTPQSRKGIVSSADRLLATIEDCTSDTIVVHTVHSRPYGNEHRFDAGPLDVPPIAQFTYGEGINGIALDGQTVWVATNAGLVRLKQETDELTVFTRENSGLPASNVLDVALRDSVLWFACDFEGIGFYDGNHWRIVHDSVPRNLCGDETPHLAIDSSGNVWAVHWDGGLLRYAASDTTVWNKDNSPYRGYKPNEIEVDRTGNVWLAEDKGLLRFDGERWHTFASTDGLAPMGRIRDVTIDAEGGVLMAGDTLVARYSDGEWQTISPPDHLAFGGRNRCIAVGTEGTLWIGTWQGLNCLREGVWHAYADLPFSRVTALACGGDQCLWVGSDQGLYLLEKDTLTKIRTSMGELPGYLNGPVVEDTGGRRWFCGTDGLSSLHNGRWVRHGDRAGQDTLGGVRSIVRRNNGALVVATSANRLHRIGPEGTVSLLYDTPQSGDPRIGTMCTDCTGGLWVGMSRELVRITSLDSVCVYTDQDIDLLRHRCHTMVVSGDSSLWLGLVENFGDSGSLARYQAREWSVHRPPDHEMQGEMHVRLVDSRGAVWAGVRGRRGESLLRYDGRKWKRFWRFNSGLRGEVTSMCEDSSGTLWIATSAGLLSYDGRKWRTHHVVRTDDFGAGLRFISIIEDSLWALSRDGALGIPMELLHRNAAAIGPLRAAKPDPDWEYMAALFTSDPDSILARINRAIRREKRPEYYTRRAAALCALGRCRKAWRDIERARTMGDTGSWYMDARAQVMLCRGEYQGAIRIATQLIAQHPRLGTGYRSRAAGYAVLGILDSARADCDSAIRLEGRRYPSVYVLRADIRDKQGQHDSARQDIDLALRIGTSDQSVYSLAGRIYLHIGEYRSAVDYYSKALALEKQDVMSLGNRGLCYMHLGRFTEAQADFTLAIAADRKAAIGYTNRAAARLHLGDTLNALRDSEKALRAEDADNDVFVNAASLYAMIGRHEEAITYFRKALGSGARDCRTLDGMGLSFIHLELLDSALACFSQAVQVDSACCAAWYNSACVHAIRGDTARALASLKKSLATGFDRLDHVLQDPDLAPVRQMPAFLELMRERGYDL